MADLKTTDQLIDYMLIKYGKNVENSATARADLLAWLQEAEYELWSVTPAWFREEDANVVFTAGTASYTVATVQDILYLFNHDGQEMRKVPPRQFQRMYRPTAATAAGLPTRWSPMPPASTTRYFVYHVWPTPSDDYLNGRMIFHKKASVLVDANTSNSSFPEVYRVGVALKALRNLSLHEGKLDLADRLEKDVAQWLGGLAQKDREIFEGHI